ncbi:hypothetical protein V8E52_000039 [Russula decolorans]
MSTVFPLPISEMEVPPHDAAPPPRVDRDRSGSITATELQSALRKGDWPYTCVAFEMDTVKLLMSIFDTNRNGTIDIHEFDGLWKYIKQWEDVFRRFDKNKNNTIDSDELEQALERLGYKLSPPLQDLLKRKYDVTWTYGEAAAGGAPPAGSASSGITFDRFMRACVVVKQLKESFEALYRDPYGRVKIDEDTFLRMVFKLP